MRIVKIISNHFEEQPAAYYFLIFSFSLSMLLYRLGIYSGYYLNQHLFNKIVYSDWAKSCLTKEKPSQVLSYFFPAGGIFLYFFLSHFLLNKGIQFKNTPVFSKLTFVNLVIVALSFNHALLPLAGILWIYFFLRTFLNYKINFAALYPFSKPICLFFLLTCVLQIWLMFLPYFKNGHALISNDYMNVPEYSYLKSGPVDNLQFINKHRLGNTQQYDPRLLKQAELVENKDFIKLTPSEELKEFILKERSKYRYDDISKRFFTLNKLPLQDVNKLCQIVTNEECGKLHHLYQLTKDRRYYPYSSFEKEFVKVNHYELTYQTYAGHFFHHHHAFLGPLSALLLGKPQDQVVFLYGWFNTKLMGTIFTYVMDFTFSNYLKILYLMYPLYYSLLILVAFILFRNLWQVLFISAMCIGSCFLIGFGDLHMAPGYNPFRHFFDLFVLLSFYGYLFTKNNKRIYLFFALLFSILAYLGNKEFGLTIYIGLISAILLKFREEKFIKCKLLDWGMLALSFFALISAKYFLPKATNPVLIYFLVGVAVPKTNSELILFFLTLLNFIYLILFFKRWQDTKFKYLAIYLFVYAQASLIYFLLFFNKGHFLVLMPAWSILTMIFIKEFSASKLWRTNLETQTLPILTLIAVAFLYVPASIRYWHDQFDYLRIFKTHKIFYWDFPRAHFVTTMDPKPFKNAIDLIQKYSVEPGIYIISKYDNLLPFLADKYSEMPFLQTDLSLVSQKEMKLGSRTLLQKKPKYLFVDSDINYNHIAEIYKPDDAISRQLKLYIYSYGRSLVLENLNVFFASIKDQYKLVERGQLISVYELKPRP